MRVFKHMFRQFVFPVYVVGVLSGVLSAVTKYSTKFSTFTGKNTFLHTIIAAVSLSN